MKYISQFGIIMGVSLLGEFLKNLLPLPVPSAVWGMILMFLFLCSGIIKLKQVEQTADFLLEIMPMLFVPVSAGIMTSFLDIKNELIGIVLVSVISTIVCFGATGIVTEAIIHILDKKKKGGNL